jgi:hypothetical protein
MKWTWQVCLSLQCDVKNIYHLFGISNLVNWCQGRRPVLCWLIHEKSVLVLQAKILSKYSPGPWWIRNRCTGPNFMGCWADVPRGAQALTMLVLGGSGGRRGVDLWGLQKVNWVRAIDTAFSDTIAAILNNNYFCTQRLEALITVVRVRTCPPLGDPERPIILGQISEADKRATRETSQASEWGKMAE